LPYRYNRLCTLTEIALAWNLMIVDSMPRKPLILVGTGWKAVFEEMFRSLGELTPPDQRRLLRFAPDVQAAMMLISDSNTKDTKLHEGKH
jgi:predicted Rossmann-fold nucleotide-binding protein